VVAAVAGCGFALVFVLALGVFRPRGSVEDENEDEDEDDRWPRWPP
jgi:hypothetical protein